MPNLGSVDLLYPISGFCVGALIGMTGIGGGSLLTPLLILLFGIHPATAVGTDLLFAASTKTIGTIVHVTVRTVDWKLVGLLAVGSVPATMATLIFLAHFDLGGVASQHAITLLLGSVLIVTALFLIAGKRIYERYAGRLDSLDRRIARFFTIVLGVVMGVLVTTTSVGAGADWRDGSTAPTSENASQTNSRVGHRPRGAADASSRYRSLVSWLH